MVSLPVALGHGCLPDLWKSAFVTMSLFVNVVGGVGCCCVAGSILVEAREVVQA